MGKRFIKEKIIKYNSKIKKIKIINDTDILLESNNDIKILTKDYFSLKKVFSENSNYKNFVNNKLVIIVNNEIQIIDFYLNRVIFNIKIEEDMTSFALSSILFAAAKKNGEISIYSLIRGKISLNLNIFKKAIKQISFCKEDIIVASSKESIRGIDIINKRVIFKIDETCEISTFQIIDDKLFVSTFRNELKIYNIKNSNLEKDFNVDNVIYKMKFKNNILILQYQNKLESLNIHSFKRNIIDEDRKFLDFDIKDNELIAIDDEQNIIRYFSYKQQIKNEYENSKKIKFLTVDDSVTMRMILKNIILNNFKNTELFEAKDGIECLEFLEQQPDIDVILMDWDMPKLNGEKTVDKIKENPKYKNIKIVMATTINDKKNVEKMLKKGIKGYLIKPFKEETIIPFVKKLIHLVEKENKNKLKEKTIKKVKK